MNDTVGCVTPLALVETSVSSVFDGQTFPSKVKRPKSISLWRGIIDKILTTSIHRFSCSISTSIGFQVLPDVTVTPLSCLGATSPLFFLSTRTCRLFYHANLLRGLKMLLKIKREFALMRSNCTLAEISSLIKKRTIFKTRFLKKGFTCSKIGCCSSCLKKYIQGKRALYSRTIY